MPAQRKRTASSRARKALKKKFHGTIEVESPRESGLIQDGTRVLVALREVSFGELPGPGENQLRLVLSVETDADNGRSAGALKVDAFRYVPDHSALNIRDALIYSGAVRGHLTVRCAIQELDLEEADTAGELAGAVFAVAADLASGPAAALLGGVPTLAGALLGLNRDDQILVLHHSFYTAPTAASLTPERGLRPGLYTFRKIARPGSGGGAQVTLKLEVIPAG